MAWTVPLRTISTAHTDGAYATTPVIVNGVVYVQDLQSNVMAISLATGQVLWTHAYNSPNGGPDGVNVVSGVVYGATTTPRSRWTPRPEPAVEPDADRQRPRGHRHDPGLRPRHRVRVHRAGQPGRGRVPRRRQGDPVGAECPDRRAGVVLGRGAGPVGQPGSTPAAASGTRPRSTPRATCTSAWPTPARCSAPRATRWGAAGRVPTCTPTRWSSSARRASCCGTTS